MHENFLHAQRLGNSAAMLRACAAKACLNSAYIHTYISYRYILYIYTYIQYIEYNIKVRTSYVHIHTLETNLHTYIHTYIIQILRIIHSSKFRVGITNRRRGAASNQGMLRGVVSLHRGEVANRSGHSLVRDLDESVRHLVRRKGLYVCMYVWFNNGCMI